MASGATLRRALVALVVVLLWLPTLDAPFTYDDKIEVIGNPTIRVVTEWSAIAGYNLARPVLIATYAVNWWLGGFDPFGYHVVSIGIHALNAVLAARLLARFVPGPLPEVAALLWAVHPMTIEGATYIAGRSDALCATWWLLALTSWVDARPRAALGWFACALLTKEVAVTLPLAMVVLGRLKGLRDLRPLRPLLAVVVVGGLARLAAFDGPEVPRGPVEHVVSQGSAWLLHVRLWLLPLGQSVLHDLPAVVSAQGLAGLALWGAGLAWGRSRPYVALAALWLLPPSLLPLKEVMAEHRSYLAGLVLAAVAARSVHVGWLVVPLAALTWARNDVWRSEVSLWADAAAKNPASADAAYGHGDALRFAGRPAEAEAAYRRTLDLRPGDTNAWNNLGIALADQGRLAEAEATWRALLRQDPRACAAHNNLAALDLREERLAEAAAGYASTLRACPDDALAMMNLGKIALRRGDLALARDWFRRYLEVAPMGAHRADVEAALRRIEG